MKEIFTRVSVRKFLPTPVENDKIEKILRAAMASPSAKNQQPWEFFVVTAKDKLLELSHATPYSMCVKNAPLAFVLAMRNQNLIAPSYREIDLAIAAETMWLEIVSLGLGAVMIGVAPIQENKDNVRKILNISEELDPFMIMPCGYPEKQKEPVDRFDPARIHYVQ